MAHGLNQIAEELRRGLRQAMRGGTVGRHGRLGGMRRPRRGRGRRGDIGVLIGEALRAWRHPRRPYGARRYRMGRPHRMHHLTRRH